MSQVRELVSMKAELKNLKLVIEAGKDVPENLLGDHRRLLQVIINLAYNAIKYTFNGSIDIHFKQTINEERLLIIEIEDTGIGIPNEDLKKLTQLFGLVDKKSTENETGIYSTFIYL